MNTNCIDSLRLTLSGQMPTQTAKCQEKKSDLVQADLAAQSETYLRGQGRAMNLTGTSFRDWSLGTYRSLS